MVAWLRGGVDVNLGQLRVGVQVEGCDTARGGAHSVANTLFGPCRGRVPKSGPVQGAWQTQHKSLVKWTSRGRCSISGGDGSM